MEKRFISVLAVFIFSLLIVGCTSGPYPEIVYVEREDPGRDVALDKKWTDTDMKLAAEHFVNSLLAHPSIKNAQSKPVIMVGQVVNRTSEHIDVKSFTDKLTTALLKADKVRLVDETAREELKKEYEYHDQGYISPDTAKGKGKQIGEDYLLRGDITSSIHEAGRKKVIYYKLTMQLVDLETNLQVWKDDYEIKKLITY